MNAITVCFDATRRGALILGLLAILAGLVGAVHMQAAPGDTLRVYDRRYERVTYRSQGCRRQCLRIRLSPRTVISDVIVWLTGPPGTAGTLEVFGHEGGMLAPRLERPLVQPRPLVKTRAGREAVAVRFEDPLMLTGGQVFFSVADLPNEVRLLCSGLESTAECWESNGQGRYASLQQSTSGQWVFTGFLPWIDVVSETPLSNEGRFEKDTLIDDLSDRAMPSGGYVSCFDLQADGRVDVACSGVLLLNQDRGFVSLDLTGPDGVIPYAFGCDVDGDGVDELLSMRLAGESSVHVHSLSASSVLTRRSDIPLPTVLAPSSMSQYDVNGDGRTDIVLSGVDVTAKSPRCLLLLSEGHNAYQSLDLLDAATLERLRLDTSETPSVQFVPPVTKAAGLGLASRLLVRSQRGEIILVLGHEPQGPRNHVVSHVLPIHHEVGLGTGTSYVRDSVLAAPLAMRWSGIKDHAVGSELDALTIAVDPRLDSVVRAAGDYEESLSSIILVDLDNDGLDEYIVCSRGRCRYLRVLTQGPGGLSDVTSRFGLDGIDDAADVTTADFDLDGRIDIALCRRGRFEMWMNKLHVTRCSFSILTSDVHDVTLRAKGDGQWLHTSGVSGRGRLVQDVRAVQSARLGDTLVVRWADRRPAERHPTAGSSRIVRGAGRTDLVSTSPKALMIVHEHGGLRFTVDNPLSDVRVSIVALDGRVIARMRREGLAPGEFAVPLTDITGGQELASGQYTAIVEGEGVRESCTIVVLR